MSIELPPLPYAKNALEPHISAETIEYHYGKHHAAYVTKINAAISADSSLEGKSLEELVKTSSGGVFNNAAQVWNHNFYWQSMSPSGGGEPTGPLAEAINDSFGSFENFKKKFSDEAAGHFGSGWAWLVKDDSGKLQVVGTHDASNPIKENKGTPLMTCDVWEHAFYIDYRNAKPNYIAAWWNTVNWEFASANFQA